MRACVRMCECIEQMCVSVCAHMWVCVGVQMYVCMRALCVCVCAYVHVYGPWEGMAEGDKSHRGQACQEGSFLKSYK